MNETMKRVTLWIVSVGGWLYAVGTACWATLEYDPNHGNFAPQWMGLSVFLSMGFAIASGVSLGRINSVRTLARIFQSGMSVAEDAARRRHDEDKEDAR